MQTSQEDLYASGL